MYNFVPHADGWQRLLNFIALKKYTHALALQRLLFSDNPSVLLREIVVGDIQVAQGNAQQAVTHYLNAIKLYEQARHYAAACRLYHAIFTLIGCHQDYMHAYVRASILAKKCCIDVLR